MDTRTGKIYRVEGETELDQCAELERLRKKLDAAEGDIVMLDKLPDSGCKRCGGTGRRRPMFSKRYVQCRCTKAFWGRK